MNKNIKLFTFLAVVSAISGLLIGFVFQIVNPIIIENDIKAEQRSLETIFPGATFETIDYVDESKVVLAVYKAEGNGFVVKAKATGYNSSNPVTVLVGFDEDGKTVAVSALQMQETSGYGSRCFEEANIESLYLNRGLDEDVDMLSGATLTSKAMKTIVSAAQNAVKEVR